MVGVILSLLSDCESRLSCSASPLVTRLSCMRHESRQHGSHRAWTGFERTLVTRLSEPQPPIVHPMQRGAVRGLGLEQLEAASNASHQQQATQALRPAATKLLDMA